MSLHPEEIPPVPEETRRVAQAVFPGGNVCVRVRDELGAISDDYLFAPLFPARGQRAAAPWRPALTTVVTPDGTLLTTEDLPNRIGGGYVWAVWCVRESPPRM